MMASISSFFIYFLVNFLFQNMLHNQFLVNLFFRVLWSGRQWLTLVLIVVVLLGCGGGLGRGLCGLRSLV